MKDTFTGGTKKKKKTTKLKINCKPQNDKREYREES